MAWTMTSENPREFSIGGLRVAFEDTGRMFRLTIEGNPLDRQALQDVFVAAVQANGHSFENRLGGAGKLEVPYPEDAIQGIGLNPQVSGEGLLRVLESLQKSVRNKVVLQSRKRALDRESSDYFAALLERQAEAKTSGYFTATLDFLESIGQPLNETHKASLKRILCAAYISGSNDRSV